MLCRVLAANSTLISVEQCIDTACNNFASTIQACQSQVNYTASPEAYIQCICSNPTQYSSYLDPCYSCAENFENQTLFQTVAALADVCNAAVTTQTTGAPTTINIAMTSRSTLCMIAPTSTSGAESVVSRWMSSLILLNLAVALVRCLDRSNF